MSGRSIRSKVVRQTLELSVATIILMLAVSVASIIFLRYSAVHVSRILGTSAASDSKLALEVQNMELLQTLAKNKADLSDQKLTVIENNVKMMTDNATHIMQNADDYKSVSIEFPSAENKGVVTSQLRLAEGVDIEEVREEIGLLANNQFLFTHIVNYNEDVRSAYLGTETGVSISVDGDSHNKTNVFDPRERSWYKAAKNNGSLIWSDVFDDASGRGLGITCAAPFYNTDGELAGIVGIGMILENLNNIVIETKIGETGYAFIMNEKGQVIISPHIQKDNEGNIIREELLESSNPRMREIARKMVGRQSGIEKITLNNTEHFIAYEPFTALNWSLAAIIPVEEAIKMATESENNIISLEKEAFRDIDFGVRTISVVYFVLLAAIVASVVFMSRQISNRLTEPIIKLTEGAKIIGDGDLSYKLSVRTGDEIETLSDTFNKMIGDITNITKEKERIGAELDVARQIQSSMLPSIFPPFPQRDDFDIYATMLPAKEVGGDFYDFFLLDDDHVCVVIADVSGKGVPAALFMVVAKTLIKNSAQSGKSPQEVFETVNNQLCENNKTNMFVTAFMGILQISTGKLAYVNAGHNPPIYKTADGVFEWLPTQPGLFLAGYEGMPYAQDEITLPRGSVLFMYTDGVTEAMDKNESLFTEARLIEVINSYGSLDIFDLLAKVKSEIDVFAGDAEQADDITMMALKVI